MNVLDLFSGCGGISLGFKLAGFKIKGGVDIDPNSVKAFQKNFLKSKAICENLLEYNDDKILEDFGNQEILVCNTHLDHVYETTREQQISVLIDQLQLVNKSNLPIILMGDFNEGPNGKVRSQINSKLPNLIDPWDAVESGSHHKFDGNNKNSLRIDWILIDKIFKKEKIYLEQSHENNIYPSDHFPVKCILNF